MTSMHRRGGAILAVGAILISTGCVVAGGPDTALFASSPSSSLDGSRISSPTGAPESGLTAQQRLVDPDRPEETITVSWLEDGRVAITTRGSSACPAIPLELVGADRSQLVIGYDGPETRVCTADLADTTTTVERPKAWSPGTELRMIEVDGRSVLEPRR